MAATTPNRDQINIRVSADLKARLDTYSELAGQSKATIAAQALSDYLDWRIPQIEDLKIGLAAAERADFATEDEVQALFTKFGA